MRLEAWFTWAIRTGAYTFGICTRGASGFRPPLNQGMSAPLLLWDRQDGSRMQLSATGFESGTLRPERTALWVRLDRQATSCSTRLAISRSSARTLAVSNFGI